MKQAVAAMAIVALLLNSYLVFDQVYEGGGDSIWETKDDDDKEEALSDLTVRVPPHKMNDMATYDYLIVAEMFWEDYETGNWSLYRLTLNGNLRHWYKPTTVERRDGFWDKHTTVHFEMDTQASFTLFVDAHDAEPLTIEGSLDGTRNEYTEIKEKQIINTFTEGMVEIDRLPRSPVGLTYEGQVESYIDPNHVLQETLESRIFGDGKQVKLNDNGTIVQSKYYEQWDMDLETVFEWEADRAVKLRGFKTLHLNINSMFFDDFMRFNEQLWISSECSFPVKRFTRTNQSWEDEGGLFYIFINTTNTLVESGYNAGDIDIPWGHGGSADFFTKHPDGEWQDWKYIPAGGNGISASSFDFKTEDADEFARANSPGLQAFLNKYDQGGEVLVTYAGYNASKVSPALDPNGKAGSYRWNLTYGYRPTEEETDIARETNDWNFSYNLVIIKNVTKAPLNEYEETIEMEHDWGLRRGNAALERSDLANRMLTLASSEDIMMAHPRVKEVVADRNNEIEWGDFETSYGLGLAGLGSGGPGYMLLEIITGITLPSAEFAWALQMNTVYESGDTFSAAVDADTGMLVYVLEISGTELIGMFD